MTTSLVTVDSPRMDLFATARHIALAGVAGLIAGVLVAGIGGRVFMRIAGAVGPELVRGVTRTEAGFIVGEVTLEGTLELVIFVGIFGGLVGSVHYIIFQPWLSWTGRWRGPAFGVVLFALGSATSDLLNPDNFDFAILGNSLLLVSLILVLFVAFGIVINLAFEWLDSRVPAGDDVGGLWAAGFILITLMGLPVAFVLVPFSLFSTDVCSCDPPWIASAFVVLAAIGTVLWLMSNRDATTRSRAALVGYVGLAGTLVFGLIRAVSDSIEIIG